MSGPTVFTPALTPKQKAKLKGLANGISQRYLLGKSEPDEGFLVTVDKALEAKELIKVGLLQSCLSTPKEVAALLEAKLRCQTVQIIGRVVVLYRRSQKNPRIEP
ncbi:MAG: YhbY family RNA-binding protein [Bacilli bacterium]|nr:YhbY family RNA-binding protein [Bacilli bacterium]